MRFTNMQLTIGPEKRNFYMASLFNNQYFFVMLDFIFLIFYPYSSKSKVLFLSYSKFLSLQLINQINFQALWKSVCKDH